MLDRPLSSATLPRSDLPAAFASRMARLCDVLAANAKTADDAHALTPATWAALHASGLLLAPFPPELGGMDLGTGDRYADLATSLRQLGAADLAAARLVEGHVNAVLLVRRYGRAEQLAHLADAIADGGLSGVWGAEGPVKLEARPSRDGWMLTGGKVLASGAGLVTHPLVPAATARGQVLIMPVLRRRERADLSGWTAQGMRASATGAVDLTGLVVAQDGMIGAPGDFTRQPAFSGGAWRFCAVHLGAAERLVDLLRQHLMERGRGDDPYQLQRIATAAIAVGSARFWIAEAARKLAHEGEPSDTVVAFANLTRTMTERAALDVLELVHRGIGLAGFLRPHPVERISRDLATYLRQPVPDLAMADAARAILASDRATADLWSLGA